MRVKCINTIAKKLANTLDLYSKNIRLYTYNWYNDTDTLNLNMEINEVLDKAIESYTTEYNRSKDLQRENDDSNYKYKNIQDKIQELRELVWLQDIPHPTIPEYRELHEKMQKILKFIDENLIEE